MLKSIIDQIRDFCRTKWILEFQKYATCSSALAYIHLRAMRVRCATNPTLSSTARSYADNFRPTGNELCWKPRKRRRSGFVIYQTRARAHTHTHALPQRRFPPRENDLSTVRIIIIIIRSNHRTRSFDHVVRTLLAGLTCLTCISNLVVYNKFPTWMEGGGKSECFSSGILSSNEKVRLNYLIGVSRSFACWILRYTCSYFRSKWCNVILLTVFFEIILLT